MGPVTSEQEEQEHDVLLLDTTVDSTVDFTALSVLSEFARRPGRTDTPVGSSTSTSTSTSTLPVVPVAGSKGWLPSMIDVGRKEVRIITRIGSAGYVRVISVGDWICYRTGG